MKTTALKTSFVRVLFTLAVLFSGAQSFAQVQGESFSEEQLSCQAVSFVMGGETHTLKISAYGSSSWNGADLTSGMAMIRAGGEAFNPDETTFLTGSLIEKDPNFGSFNGASSSVRLSVDVNATPLLRQASHIKLEFYFDGSWVTMYDGGAECGFNQYESIGAHN